MSNEHAHKVPAEVIFMRVCMHVCLCVCLCMYAYMYLCKYTLYTHADSFSPWQNGLRCVPVYIVTYIYQFTHTYTHTYAHT